MAVFSLLFCIFVALPAAAQWAPTHGGELELSDEELKGQKQFDYRHPFSTPEKRAQMRFVERMRERCKSLGCIESTHTNKWSEGEVRDVDYRFTFPNGWWLQVSYDPYCVEVTFKEMTSAELRAHGWMIDDYIFGTGRDVNLRVMRPDNSHYNYGLKSAFGESAEAFLRSFVDYSNRPDLALGSVGHSFLNAPPLAALGDDQRQSLVRIVRRMNLGRIRTHTDLALAIQTEVYTRTISNKLGATKAQAIGLRALIEQDLATGDVPVETRPVWIQGSAAEFTLVAELFESRFLYLQKQTGPIYYSGTGRTEFTKSELNSRFYIYVVEMDRSYKKFSALLPEDVRAAPLADFLRDGATFEEKLASAPEYWDLIEISPWVRDRIVGLLTSPSTHASERGRALIERLERESRIAAPGIAAPFVERYVRLKSWLAEAPPIDHSLKIKSEMLLRVRGRAACLQVL